MKNAIKIGLLASVVLAGVETTRAESYGDLIIGFTTQTGNDSMEDIGSVASLSNGKTWNLANLITNTTANFTIVNWGIIANASYNSGLNMALGFTTAGTGYNNVDTYWLTLDGSAAPTAIGEGYYNSANTTINTILGNFPNGVFNTQYPDSLKWPASDDASWNKETLSGTLQSDFVNAITSPNVVGQATAAFWVVPPSGSPTHLGNFTLSNTGVLTYNTLSSTPAPVASFTGTPIKGFAPLKAVFTDASTGTITNWVWNFGNGLSVTNLTSVSVTNTYAAAGSFTVSEKVTGPAGSSTNTQTAYIVVSATPKLGAPTLSGTNMVFLGTNGPVGVQYRILTSTNLATGSWTPVVTNTVSSSGKYGYTNSMTKAAAYFLLVSP